MKVETIEREGDRLSLFLEDVSVITANSVRRTIITDVPTMAIDYIFVYENNSVVNDQILAHRLGLIPLTTNLEDYVLHEECVCGLEYGCPKCAVSLSIEAEAEDSVRTVFSGEIKSEDESVLPVNPDIPLLKLSPGQRVILEMRSLLGRGVEHVKWQPTSKIIVRGKPIFEVDETLCDECAKCIKECPPKIVTLNPKPVLTDVYLCTLCKLCERNCPPGAIKVDINETSSILSLESNGQLSPLRIVESALSILISKSDELKRLFEEC